MKKYKKVIGLLLGLTLSVSLAACGGTPENAGNTTEAPSAEAGSAEAGSAPPAPP